MWKLLAVAAIPYLVSISNPAYAGCNRQAIEGLFGGVENALFQERKLLWGAATNPSDDSTRGAYLRQWGALGSGKGGSAEDYLVPEPQGARTVLNQSLAGLKAYLASCSE